MSEVYVMDASVLLAHMLNEPEGRQFDGYLDRAAERRITLVAPSLLYVECVNALIVAERRGRMKPEDRKRRVEYLAVLPIQTVSSQGEHTLQRIAELAVKHRLSAYDATYLELAERLDARLITLDKELRALKRTYPWIGE